MSNPFAVLGLTHEVLRGLTLTQAEGLVKSQYRALQLIHHSDRRPSGETSEKELAITAAYELLESEDAFKECLESYLVRKAQQHRLEESKQVQQQLDVNARIAQQYIKFLMTFAERPDKLTIFNLPDCRFAMHDTIRYLNAGSPLPPMQGSPEVFYYLHHQAGKFTQVKTTLTKEVSIQEYESLVLVGTVKEESGEVGSVKQMLLRAQPENRLLLPSQEHRQRKGTPHRLISGKKIRLLQVREEYPYLNFSQYIGQNEFSEIASRLSPDIEPHTYLFGIDMRLRSFVFLGRIRAIELTSHNPVT